jgi:hypothetical protein
LDYITSDRQKYEPILRDFIGETCHHSIACNSIKIRFEKRDKLKRQGYIWIDPPWSFMQNGELIADAYLCPHYEDIDYRLRFQEWCNLFHPLNQSIFTGYEFLEDNSLHLSFHDSYQIHIPKYEDCSNDEDPEQWYLQWYASPFQEEQAN